jgi:cation diffusion facilitator family transporter
MPNESTRTVLVALGAGLGIALTKVGAAAFTGSAAMAAEASHSLADSANDVLLFVAQLRSSHRPDDQHPLGYGREVYFWTLIAALGVFIGGAAFSLREGIEELIHPGTTSSFLVAYVVLAFSTAFDLVSVRQSAGQMARRARLYNREFLEESHVTSDTTLRAVFSEDVVSVVGDVITFAALGLNQITGSSIPQGVAAILIALVMIRISLRLVQRSHDFLVGAWVMSPSALPKGDGDLTRAFRPADEERIRGFLLGYPGVAGIRELLLTFVGPGRVWVVARIHVDGALSGVEIESLVHGIESGMKAESQDIYRVDVVPIGGADVAQR